MSVHVPDMMVIAGKERDYIAFCKFLNESFPANNLGILAHYTGFAFTRNRSEGVLKVTQTTCIDKLTDGLHATH